jgi:predicted dehydrogenase
VVEALFAAADVRHLVLEKVLFQRPDDYDTVAALVAARGASAWVNCPRRLWPHYRALREEARGPVHVSVTGSDWGLACNAVHFIDLAAWLGGDDEWRFATAALDAGTRPSRRAGYLEVTGTLTGTSANGSRVTLTSRPDGNLPALVSVEGASFRHVVREGEGKAWVQDAAAEWRWREAASPALYQSQLSDRVVAELLESGRSSLTPLAASSRHHLAFLSALAQHMGVETCPIT